MLKTGEHVNGLLEAWPGLEVVVWAIRSVRPEHRQDQRSRRRSAGSRRN